MTGWKYLSQNRRPKDPRRIVVERQRYGPNWIKQKKACLERDSMTCQKCGHVGHKVGKYWDVSAHHIIKIKNFVSSEGIFDWGSANSLDNLITLCEINKCHGTADSHVSMKGFVMLK